MKSMLDHIFVLVSLIGEDNQEMAIRAKIFRLSGHASEFLI